MSSKLLNLENAVKQFSELIGFGCKAVEKIMVEKEIAKYSEKLLESDLEFVKSKCFSTVLSFYEGRLRQIKKEEKESIENMQDDYQLVNQDLFDLDSFIAAVKESSGAMAYGHSTPKFRAEVSKQLINGNANCVAKYSEKTRSNTLNEEKLTSNDKINKDDNYDLKISNVGEISNKNSDNNICSHENTTSDENEATSGHNDECCMYEEDSSEGDEVVKIYKSDGDDSCGDNKKELNVDKRKENDKRCDENKFIDKREQTKQMVKHKYTKLKVGFFQRALECSGRI